MYQQIIGILKQNNIKFTDILWSDEFGKLQLNNNEDYNEYVFGEDKAQMCVWFLQGNRERKFDIVQQLNINGILILILKENKVE